MANPTRPRSGPPGRPGSRPILAELRTPRLRLEPLEESHAGALFEGLQDPALYEFIADRAPLSVGALAERHRRLAARKSPDGRAWWLNWAVRSLEDWSYVGYVQATVAPDRSAEIAYVLFRPAWGRGYGREAVTALVEHLRERWGSGRVRAQVDLRNRRSIALLERLGFERGAVRKNAEEIRGALADEVVYDLRIVPRAGPDRPA